MLTLALDTATDCLSIALAADGSLLDEDEVLAGREHLEILLPRIHGLLQRHGLSFTDLGHVVAGLGPGTFSGLRVGIATARGLAQSLGTAASGYSTLDALALGIAEDIVEIPGFVMPVIDAKRGQVFTRVYRISGSGSPEGASGIECLDPDELEAFAKKHADSIPIAGGNGVHAYRDLISSLEYIEPLPGSDSRNRVSAARLLAVAGCLDGSRMPSPAKDAGPGSFSLDGIAGLVPIYVREPDADKTVLLRKREPWQG